MSRKQIRPAEVPAIDSLLECVPTKMVQECGLPKGPKPSKCPKIAKMSEAPRMPDHCRTNDELIRTILYSRNPVLLHQVGTRQTSLVS